MAAATAGLSLRMLRASALDREAQGWPKSALVDNLLHTLKPPWIMRMVIWEIEQLAFSGRRVDAIAHAWPVWLVCPAALGISGEIVRIEKKKS